MKNRVFRARLAALFLTTVVAAPVLANVTLGEVFVTATRAEQSLETAPLGASVILGEDMIRTGMLDANEAVRLLAGLPARRDLNGGREAVIDLLGYGDAAANNVAVVVDGIRISENELASARLSAISPEMIDRIEIMRGGASVLWGEGASAGVIHVITKAGADAPGVRGAVSVGVESHGGRDARADLSVTNDLVSFSAQARRYAIQGYRENSKHDNDALNMSVTLGDKRTLRTRLSVFADQLQMRWPGALPIATFGEFPRSTITPEDYGSQSQDRMTLAFEKQVGTALWSVDLASKHREMSSFQDYGIFGTETTQTRSNTYQLSPRVTWANDWGSALINTVVGVDWTQWTYSRENSFASAPETGRQTSFAGYVRTDLIFASNWRMEAGLRAEQFDRSMDRQGVVMEDQPNLNSVELGLSRTLSAHWTAHGRVASSYRVANVDELRYLSAPLKPQEARDLEVGGRYRNGSTLISGSLFQQRTSNEIAYDDSIPRNVNLDPVRRLGLALDVAMQPTNRVALRAHLQTVDAKIQEGAYSGKALPLAVKNSALIRATYAASVANTLDLTLRLVGAAPFGNDWSNQCGRKIPAAQFWDVGYRFQASPEGTWSYFAGVDNVFNQQTFSAGYTNTACSPYNVYPDTGRRMKVNATYRFR